MTKRHAKPTPAQLMERIYRHQIASDKRLDAIEALMEHDGVGRTVLLKTITEHCWRLLREKETLMRMVEDYDVRTANAYLARPLHGRV